LKILTLNTWQKRGPWEDRWRVIFDGLLEYRPDIAAFQEVFDPGWADYVQKKTGYESLVFHPEYCGLMFLSRYPVVRSRCLSMETQAPTEDYSRYVLFAEVEAGKDRLALFNTHLSWRPEQGEIRRRQVRELLTFVDREAGAHETAVMGDFNAPPGTPEVRMVTDEAGFTDAFAALHPKEPGITWDNEHPYVRMASEVLPDRRIDYLFLRNNNEVWRRLRSVDLVFTRPDPKGIYATDHYGILAEFESCGRAHAKRR
jgi:endonuclease/exonuclease/phosphatase family metal-dependent hydrolase